MAWSFERLKVELRDYQKEAIRKIEEAFLRGRKSVLVSVPTGGGKTIIFNAYALLKGYRTLVIAHRDELLQQAIDKWVMVGGNEGEVGKIGGGEWREARYTVASIQTLSRYQDKVDGRKYDLVVWDEAHHVMADTYRAVWRRLLETNPSLKMIGATATPFRADGKNLAEVFEEIAFHVEITELIRLGYLVPVRGKIVSLDVNLDEVRERAGDLDSGDLERVLLGDGVLDAVAEKHSFLAKGRKSIYFVPTVEVARELARAFERRRIKSTWVAGSLSLSERKERIEALRNGEVKVLTNAMLLTEGFDEPSVDCVGVLRPTKSLVLYAQMVGRGLRIAPGKEDCLILDYTGVSRKHTLVGLAHLFGLDEEAYEKAGVLAVGRVEEKGGADLRVMYGEGVQDFTFEGKEVVRYATKVGREGWVVSCGLSGKVLILWREGEYYSLYLADSRGRVRRLKERLTEDYAWSVLTAVWKKEMDSFMAGWRYRAKKERLTARQLESIQKMLRAGLLRPEEMPALPFVLSKMDASNLIAFGIARAKLRR